MARKHLSAKLNAIPGVQKVYFQPPDDATLQYPCIIYSLSDIQNNSADNQNAYIQHRRYKVVVIDADPDSTIVTAVSKLPLCSFQTHYAANNLNHTIFQIYD